MHSTSTIFQQDEGRNPKILREKKAVEIRLRTALLQ
jgi:hypothetical protein